MKLLALIFSILLQISLITLKLFKVITWSWFLILLPIELYCFFFVIAFVIIGIAALRVFKDIKIFNP